MQKFQYVAYDVNKKKFKGSFLAEDMDDLRMQLARQKLYLADAKAVSEKPPSTFFSVTGKVKTVELTTFCRQFAIMINSGISIVESIRILKDQKYSGFFRRVLARVYEDIESGLLLSEAMSKHKKVFPEFFTSMVYVGERSGMLDTVLRSVADYYENDAEIKRKIKGAMAYPAVLMVLLVGILTLMMAYVIPTFEESLAKLDVEMPAITLAITSVSHWLVANWMYLILGIVTAVLLYVVIGRTKSGKYFYHTMKLKLPVIGKVQTALISAKFARGFGLLQSSGLDMVESMKVIAGVLGNKNAERKFYRAADDVSGGSTLTDALDRQKIFPTMLIQMISVGEKTGNVDKVLLQSCTYFDNQADSTLNAAAQLVQPIILIFIGATVGVLFYAMYAPMISIMTDLI